MTPHIDSRRDVAIMSIIMHKAHSIARDKSGPGANHTRLCFHCSIPARAGQAQEPCQAEYRSPLCSPEHDTDTRKGEQCSIILTQP
jgi:hypothetical protein